jgi:RNase P subunit RPR2
MKVVQLIKQYKERICPICGLSLKNHWEAKITLPVVVHLCTDCAYERKQFLYWLQDNLPATPGDLKTIGVSNALVLA